MAEDLNLIEKLAKIREISGVAKKSKKGYGYTYSDITDILANVTAGMNKYRVSLIPCIVPGTTNVIQNVVRKTKFTKSGDAYEDASTEMLFTAEMMFTWIDNDNPEDKIEVPWFVTGAQSDPAQALGTGLTYTMRQFLTSYFQIAQSDQDVDAYRSKQKEAEVAEAKAIASSIISDFDTTLKLFLAENQDKQDDVVALVKKYVRNANYKTITDPEIASRLVNDFKNTFINKEEK